MAEVGTQTSPLDKQRGVQQRALLLALEEERGHLMVALYDLATKNLEDLMEAAQLIDKECQDILESQLREQSASFPPDCKNGKCLECRRCFGIYVEKKMNGELDA